jgi:hypothetical protein
MKIVPINTWNPWNPVIIKKIEPNTESLKCIADNLYSWYWKKVNSPANTKVVYKPFKVPTLSPTIKAACAFVKKTPEANNRKVLPDAVIQGVSGIIPFGGQTPPIQIEGDKQ